MTMRHTGPHALHGMEVEYHYHPFGDEHLAAMRVVQPLPDAFDSEKRLDYQSGSDPIYIGFAEYLFISATETVTPSTSTDIWIIQKLTYNASGQLERIQVKRGAWDDRVSLFS